VHKFQCHPGYQSYGPIAIWLEHIIDFGDQRKCPCWLALEDIIDSPQDPEEKNQLVV
jgi:hypothetical protein